MLIITVARKPLSGTVAANVLRWGTGGLNIDASRVSLHNEDTSRPVLQTQSWKNTSTAGVGSVTDDWKKGRFPANLILCHLQGCVGQCQPGCPVRALDEQSGVSTASSKLRIREPGGTELGQSSGWNPHLNRASESIQWGDTGGASRFFKQVQQDTESCNRQVK